MSGSGTPGLVEDLVADEPCIYLGKDGFWFERISGPPCGPSILSSTEVVQKPVESIY